MSHGKAYLMQGKECVYGNEALEVAEGVQHRKHLEVSWVSVKVGHEFDSLGEDQPQEEEHESCEHAREV